MSRLRIFNAWRSFRSLILLALLILSIILALNTVPIKAPLGKLLPELTCPTYAVRGQTVQIGLTFQYDFSGKLKFKAWIEGKTSDGQSIPDMGGVKDFHIGSDVDKPPIHFTGQHYLSWDYGIFYIPSSAYNIQVSATVGGEGYPPESAECIIQLRDEDDPPILQIEYALVQNLTGPGPTLGTFKEIGRAYAGQSNKGIVIHSGEQYRLTVCYKYAVPAAPQGSKISWTTKYRDSISGQWTTKVTYTTGQASAGESCPSISDAHTPADFGGPSGKMGGSSDTATEWIWDVELSIDAGDGPWPKEYNKATDSMTFPLRVMHAENIRAYIYKLTAPDHIQMGGQLSVQAEGAYDIPEGQTATLHVSLSSHGGHPEPNAHDLEKLTGQGTWSEILNANQDFISYLPKIETKETSFTARFAAVIFSGQYSPGSPGQYNMLDYKERTVNVTKALPSEDFHCRITDVKHPTDATFGQDVSITVELERKLSKGSSVEISIWDKELYPLHNGELAVDTIKDAEGTGSMSFTIKIPAANIRPTSGPWTLTALSIYNTPETGRQLVGSFGRPPGYDFTVNVVGATGPKGAGGKIDWSINSVQAMPYQPTQDEPTIFQALVAANPVPTAPVQVRVTCLLDGTQLFGGDVTYGVSMGFLAVSGQPWKATLGTHTVACDVDPNQKYDDQNRANNHRELKFTVSKSYTPPPPPPGVPQGEFDFYVTATPTERTLASSVTYAVEVKLVSGTVQPVQLDLLDAPPGISYSFAPSSGAPPYTSTLTLTAAAGVPAGSYSFMIKASGGQGNLYKERYKSLTLNVKDGPTYTISVTPNTTQAKPGENLTFTISASSDTGYNNYVNLILTGVPNGSASTLEPSALIPSSQSTLTLRLGKNTDPGFYVIVVTGSGPKAPSVTVALTVIGPPVPPAPQPTDNEDLTVTGLAAGIVVGIIASIIAAVFLTFRRFKAKGTKLYCIECGAQLTPGLPYCSHCGAKQDQSGKED